MPHTPAPQAGMPPSPQGAMPPTQDAATEAPQAGAGMINSIQDPMLKRVKADAENKVEPNLKKEFDAIVLSGLKLMFSKDTHSHMTDFLKQMEAAPPATHPRLYAKGIIKLISIIFNQASPKMTQNAIARFRTVGSLAALVLLCYALEYVEGTQGRKITKEILDESVVALGSGYLKLFKIDRGTIKRSVQNGQPKPGGGVEPPPQEAPAEAAAPDAPGATPPSPPAPGVS